MRCLKLLLMGVAILALSTQAWGLALKGYNTGDVMSFHFNSVDVGPFYDYGTALTPGDCDNLQLLEAAGLRDGAGNKFINTEDAWGIAYVSNITDPTNNLTYWSAADSPTELTAIFYGTRDISVSHTHLGSGNDQLITYSDGFRFVLWEGPDTGATAYDAAQGPEARTGADVYPTVSDGTKILEAQGVYGYYNLLVSDPNDPYGWATHKSEVTLTYDINGNVIGVSGGSGHAFAEIADINGDGVIDGAGFDNDSFPTERTGVMCDIVLDWTLTMPQTPGPGEPTVGTAWWDLADQDPVKMTFIPEPVTMAGLMLGIGSLVTYVRRRR